MARERMVGLAAGLALGLALLASGPAAAQRGVRPGQPAPAITGGPWINSEPLTMEGLRGRVVYVDFWTYG
jgi:hypothetical protein